MYILGTQPGASASLSVHRQPEVGVPLPETETEKVPEAAGVCMSCGMVAARGPGW
jgi:hypothetical protein